MAFSIRDYRTIKVVQATHHQSDIGDGKSRAIQYSCMSLIEVSWTLFRSPCQWSKLDLDGILGREDQLVQRMVSYSIADMFS